MEFKFHNAQNQLIFLTFLGQYQELLAPTHTYVAKTTRTLSSRRNTCAIPMVD